MNLKSRCTKKSVNIKKYPGNYSTCTEKAVSKADCTFTALPVTYSCCASHQLSISWEGAAVLTAALATFVIYTD